MFFSASVLAMPGPMPLTNWMGVSRANTVTMLADSVGAMSRFEQREQNVRGGLMSRSRKDSRQGTVIELIKKENGTFDLVLNRELDREGIHTDGLMDVLCVR